ncbi:dephospho-CoA kinase [Enterococcus ureilyticus]|uniref:Dephospho-CoA kinase n=1 Tax=Enterococcus ureilyticus TaxID=1131292 RepID=A0A1E5HD04_9ENTE|nr:dephospho-CoA kinase [Enterococcus ureilyticus]MBM7687670.1 dephospho-CoA kinase [Enterococcus ureilyticus]MBO0446870.1 dephospho-CoA kinase [Enterococcus ureilyticus]OEG22814.1 dephospho-CoA kinase [Enterococcus ureilyticus]
MGLILGLTGGIATGKSTVVNVFKNLGFPIVDADIIAREVVEPGSIGLAEIVSVFGTNIINSDGSLNRKKLGVLIFSDAQKRKILNKILSPFIKERILAEIESKKDKASLIIVDIPLLYEGGYDKFVDQVAVVYIPEKLQLLRLMKRDHLSENEALQRIQSQLSIEEKKKNADIVFDNQENIEKTKKLIEAWVSEKNF